MPTQHPTKEQRKRWTATRKALIKSRQAKGSSWWCGNGQHWACYGFSRTKTKPCTCECHNV